MKIDTFLKEQIEDFCYPEIPGSPSGRFWGGYGRFYTEGNCISSKQGTKLISGIYEYLNSGCIESLENAIWVLENIHTVNIHKPGVSGIAGTRKTEISEIGKELLKLLKETRETENK